MQWTRGTEDSTSLQVHIVVVGKKVQQKYTVRINQHDVIPLHFLLVLVCVHEHVCGILD